GASCSCNRNRNRRYALPNQQDGEKCCSREVEQVNGGLNLARCLHDLLAKQFRQARDNTLVILARKADLRGYASGRVSNQLKSLEVDCSRYEIGRRRDSASANRLRD